MLSLVVVVCILFGWKVSDFFIGFDFLVVLFFKVVEFFVLCWGYCGIIKFFKGKYFLGIKGVGV